MENIVINEVNYEIIRNDNCLNIEELSELVTDYFDDFDFIVGDYSYDKLRLKGFNEKNNSNSINNIDNLNDYIENYCSYGSKIFVVKKIK